MRDIRRCKAKYKEAWVEYEKRVPYLFIPVSRIELKKLCFLFLRATRKLIWLEYNSMSFKCSRVLGARELSF